MRLLVPILAATLGLQAQAPRPSEVQERRLSNGARLLLVERRGLTAFHAALVFPGGRAEEPAAAAGATDLLARALYGATRPEDLEQGKGQAALEALLKQEEGLLEAIRLERMMLRRDPTVATQLPALEANLESVQAQLRISTAAAPLGDLYLSRGGRQWAEATTDALIAHTELPQETFEFWCRTEAQRLRTTMLSRFAQVRADFVTELRVKSAKGRALLFGAALPGHPYGRDLTDHRPALEALRWSELRAYAHRSLRPDRLTIILVGGLSLETALPLVERHLGSLPVPPASETTVLPEIPADLGDRRVQATAGESAHLLTGWRIPARSHPDHLALRMAAQLLAGGQSGRLQARLQRQKGLVERVELSLDQPGGRLPGLLVADLEPAPNHSLAEVESALHGEILRLQQEPISQEEWQRALAQLESDHLQSQDDPEALANALGLAWAEGGDWRLVDLEPQRLKALAPETVQAAVRAWLKPTHRTTVLLEPTPGVNLDPLDAELSRVLQALAMSRIQDPAQREHLVAEGLRQLRMLNAEERRRTLKLLMVQLPPEKQ